MARQVGDQTGEAGVAYHRISATKKLERIERVDTSRTNEELAARYGVKAASPGK